MAGGARPPAGATSSASAFYSDSTNDLPLLERATDPVATNPSPDARGDRARARLAHPETVRHDQEIHRQAARQAGRRRQGGAIPLGKRVEVPAAEHGIDPALVDERAVKVVAHAAGRRPRGLHRRRRGARPAASGLRPKDFDVATNATPEQVKALFRRAFIIGRRFRIVHVVFGRGRDARGDRGLDLPRLPRRRRGRAGRAATRRPRKSELAGKTPRRRRRAAACCATTSGARRSRTPRGATSPSTRCTTTR